MPHSKAPKSQVSQFKSPRCSPEARSPATNQAENQQTALPWPQQRRGNWMEVTLWKSDPVSHTDLGIFSLQHRGREKRDSRKLRRKPPPTHPLGWSWTLSTQPLGGTSPFQMRLMLFRWQMLVAMMVEAVRVAHGEHHMPALRSPFP